MKGERALTALGMAVALYGAVEVSKGALTTPARKEAGERDGWECQGLNGEPCYQASLNGGTPARFDNGFMITLAHYPETHHLTGKGYHDPDPNNARCLCVLCHGLEEIDRGNTNGAKKMLNMGIFTHSKEEEIGEQIYLSVEQALELREEARRMQKKKDEIEHYKKLLGNGGKERRIR